jgi:hypothetical protein
MERLIEVVASRIDGLTQSQDNHIEFVYPLKMSPLNLQKNINVKSRQERERKFKKMKMYILLKLN